MAENIFELVPVRAKVDTKRDEEGNVVIIYTKNLGRIESWLHKYVGGPLMIERPLDEMGTALWDMCDGRHTVGEICRSMDTRYQEKIEPVDTRVVQFIETLLSLGLLHIKKGKNKPRKVRVSSSERQ